MWLATNLWFYFTVDPFANGSVRESNLHREYDFVRIFNLREILNNIVGHFSQLIPQFEESNVF